jgi:hypothetical protein
VPTERRSQPPCSRARTLIPPAQPARRPGRPCARTRARRAATSLGRHQPPPHAHARPLSARPARRAPPWPRIRHACAPANARALSHAQAHTRAPAAAPPAVTFAAAAARRSPTRARGRVRSTAITADRTRALLLYTSTHVHVGHAPHRAARHSDAAWVPAHAASTARAPPPRARRRPRRPRHRRTPRRDTRSRSSTIKAPPNPSDRHRRGPPLHRLAIAIPRLYKEVLGIAIASQLRPPPPAPSLASLAPPPQLSPTAAACSLQAASARHPSSR